MIRHFQKNWQLWVMVLPAIIIVFIFNYIPMYGIQLAFREFDFQKGLTGGEFVGLKYFKMYFESPLFLPTLKNTFVIAITSLVVGFPAPIIMALAFNQIKNAKRKKAVQTIVYIPYFISTVVLVALLQILLSPTTGILDNALKAIGLVDEATNILGSTKTFVPMYVISGIWQSCGWNSIIYFAALSSVDTQLYDAAEIDGADKMQIIWNVEIPALVPTMLILLILSMGNILTVGFEKTFLLQNSMNLPVSEVISTYTYKIGMQSNQFSLGAAIGLFNTMINFIFLLGANFLSRRISGRGLW